jgi:hypothetical protein
MAKASDVECEFGNCVELSGGKLICDLLPDCGCVGHVMKRTWLAALSALDDEPGKIDWNAFLELFEFKRDERLFYAVTLMLEDRDLIEHGVSIRCPWLTNRGREALALMREHWKFPAEG